MWFIPLFILSKIPSFQGKFLRLMETVYNLKLAAIDLVTIKGYCKRSLFG